MNQKMEASLSVFETNYIFVGCILILFCIIMVKNMKYFITGGKGFIGSNLAKELSKNPKNKVVIYDKVCGQDICQKIKMENDFDVIYHLAAISSTRDDAMTTLKNNLLGFLNVIDFALKGKSKLIYASSAAVYGKYKKTAYAVSKIAGDEIAQYFFDKMPIVGLRPFNVFGPNEIQKGHMASIIAQWTVQLKKDERPKAFGSERKSRRDHIYVKDMVKALIQAIHLKNGIYDVGTGKPRTYDDVLKAVQKTLGTDLKPIFVKNPYKGAYQRYTKADVSWGFRADYTLEGGVKDYLEKNFPHLTG